MNAKNNNSSKTACQKKKMEYLKIQMKMELEPCWGAAVADLDHQIQAQAWKPQPQAGAAHVPGEGEPPTGG
jgi:hypothetical protein